MGILALLIGFGFPSHVDAQGIPEDDLPMATLSAPERAPMSESVSYSVSRAHQEGELRLSLIAAPSGYFPSRLFVKKDIPLRIFLTNVGQKESCFILHMGEDAQKSRGLASAPTAAGSLQRSARLGEVKEIHFIPRKTGTYSFGCPIQGIKGKLVVRE